MIIYLTAFSCVVGMAVGQILFKVSAVAFRKSENFFAIEPLLFLFSALLLYGATSVAWVWVLQKVELGRIYPLMALAFILVPLGSHIVFGEHFQSQYYIGVLMIIVGIFISLGA